MKSVFPPERTGFYSRPRHLNKFIISLIHPTAKEFEEEKNIHMNIFNQAGYSTAVPDLIAPQLDKNWLRTPRKRPARCYLWQFYGENTQPHVHVMFKRYREALAQKAASASSPDGKGVAFTKLLH